MYTVLKANKKREPFSEEKVIDSIRRAGISENLRDEVLRHVITKLYEGISTAEIYQHIIEFLEKSENPYTSSRYSLKQGIMDLGPTGYPFEDFIAKLMQADGYQTKVRQILQGECITHEIDVLAQKNDKTIMIEAKYHNSPGTRSQIHVALYVQARFEDIMIQNQLDEAWLVTNTKTTTDVNTYASCKNIKVISWSYPKGQSLRDLVEKFKLYPITLLTSLNQSQKRILLENHTIMCRDLVDNPRLLEALYLPQNRQEEVLAEANYVCKNG